MIVIVGCVVVIVAILVGFIGSGGNVAALFHPFEFVTIGGAAVGALIIMSPAKVLKDLMRSIVASLKGSPFNRVAYEDLFRLLYALFQVARRDGLISLEPHLSDTASSSIFNKYPRIAKNHHVTEFICGALTPVVEGTIKPESLHSLLKTEIELVEKEHHAPLSVLQKTADALPGFGIVAAVMGIVITMASIDGPVEEIGEKVGAALVGTFLGILLSYGFAGPLSVRIEFLGAVESDYFHTIARVIESFVNGAPPKVALEHARRGVRSECRMSRDQLDAMFKEVETS